MVPSGPTTTILKKMVKVSVDENDIRLVKMITSTRCFLVCDHAEGMVFGADDKKPFLLHTTLNFVKTDILIIIGA